MGSLNDWCDEDEDKKPEQAVSEPEPLPEIKTLVDTETSVETKKDEDAVLDLSKYFESFDTVMNDCDALIQLNSYISNTGNMSRGLALEAAALCPNLGNKLRPKMFTEEESCVGRELALEAISPQMMALIAAGIAAVGVLIAKVIKSFTGGVGGGKNSGNGGSAGHVDNISSGGESVAANMVANTRFHKLAVASDTAVRELCNHLKDSAILIDGVLVRSLDDIDKIYSAFIDSISDETNDPFMKHAGFTPPNRLLAPITLLSAAVRHDEDFVKRAISVQTAAVAAAKATLSKLKTVKDELKKVVENNSSRFDDVANVVTGGGPDVDFQGEDIKATVKNLTGRAPALIAKQKKEVAEFKDLSKLLNVFYSHDIEKAHKFADQISACNDDVIEILKTCEVLQDELSKEIDKQSAKIADIKTIRIFKDYVTTVKETLSVVGVGTEMAQKLRNDWVNDTTNYLKGVIEFMRYILSKKEVRDNHELHKSVDQIVRDLHSKIPK